MQIQSVPLEQLQPAPYNPRISLRPGSDEYRRLKRSLEEFDLVQPLVWNEQTGHVVGGNQRLEVLKNQGVREVDVVVVSLPLEREKALNIALNNTQVGGDWDSAKLLEVMSQLHDLPNVDATLTGFDEDEIQSLLLEPDPDLPDDLDPEEADNTVRATIEVPEEQWEQFRPALDRLMADWNLPVHVKLPGT